MLDEYSLPTGETITKLKYITRHRAIPEFVREFQQYEITKWLCEDCNSITPITINPQLKSFNWRCPYYIAWFVKCNCCNKELVPQVKIIYDHEMLDKKKWYCHHCGAVTKLVLNKLWLKLHNKKIFDKREIEKDLDGDVIICGKCKEPRYLNDTSCCCPDCGWADNSGDDNKYIVNKKEYPIITNYHPACGEYSGYDWDETHCCPFCKKEFEYGNSSY